MGFEVLEGVRGGAPARGPMIGWRLTERDIGVGGDWEAPGSRDAARYGGLSLPYRAHQCFK